MDCLEIWCVITSYGYDFGVGERFGEAQIAHNGGIHGFATSGIWLPKQKTYVAVLSNSGDIGAPGYLAARLAFDAGGIEYPKLVAIDIDAEKLREYQGVYQITEDQTRTVTVEDGRLYTQRTGGGRLEALPRGEDAFFYAGGFTHLVFKRDRDGKVIGMDMYQDGNDDGRAKSVTLFQNGIEQVAKRIE